MVLGNNFIEETFGNSVLREPKPLLEARKTFLEKVKIHANDVLKTLLTDVFPTYNSLYVQHNTASEASGGYPDACSLFDDWLSHSTRDVCPTHIQSLFDLLQAWLNHWHLTADWCVEYTVQ